MFSKRDASAGHRDRVSNDGVIDFAQAMRSARGPARALRRMDPSLRLAPGMGDATTPSMHAGTNPFSRPVRDLMERDVLTVSPETSVFDIQRMFVEEEIHGAPVVDDNGPCAASCRLSTSADRA